MVRELVALVLVLTPVAAASACGGGDPGAEPAPGAAVGVEVSAREFSFDPAISSVDGPGSLVVRVANDGSVPHALRLEGGQVDETTAEILPGETAHLKVDLAEGSYTLSCPLGDHRERGMEAVLRVGETAAPTPAPAQTDESDRAGVYGY